MWQVSHIKLSPSFSRNPRTVHPSTLTLRFVAAYAAIVARANELVAFGDLPFSDHAIAAQKNPEPTGYASRIQLFSKGKTDDAGNAVVEAGHFAIVDGDAYNILGKEIDVVPLAVLDKALDCSGDEVTVAFGRETETYQRIAEDSKTQDSGCMYGPVFLVFERTTSNFYEVFFNNASGRREAPKLYPYLPIGEAAAKANGLKAQPPRPCQIQSKFVNPPKSRYSWFAPQVGDTTAVFDSPPAQEAAVNAVKNFLKQAVVEDEGRER